MEIPAADRQAVFFLLFNLFILPAKWVVESRWSSDPPKAIWVALQAFALISAVIAGWSTWRLWKRLRPILSGDSTASSRTWLDGLSPSLRLPLALCLVVAGATIMVLSIGNDFPRTNWRHDVVLLGGLIQGAGLIGVVLALRRPS